MARRFGASQKKRKNGYIDTKGKEIAPCVYDYAGRLQDDYSFVRLGDKWGVMGKSGKLTAPCELELDSVARFCGGMGRAWRKIGEDEYIGGFVNPKGELIAFGEYENRGNFHEGLACVEKDGKWGYIDKRGILVIPCAYDYADGFCEGRAKVQKGDFYAYIDKKGRQITDFIYEYGEWFMDGVAWVRREGKDGFINRKGREVVACVYDWVGGRDVWGYWEDDDW